MTTNSIKLIEYQNPYWKDNPQYFLELLALVKAFPKNGSYIRRLKANGRKRELNAILPYKHLRIWIEAITQQYDSKIRDLTARIYWVLHGLVESPICLNENCNTRLDNARFDFTKLKQPCYCSNRCLNTCKLHTKHANETKHKHSKEYWKAVEQKRKHTKMKNGHEPNWNNIEKGLHTKQQHFEKDPNYYCKIEQKRKHTKMKNGHEPNWHNQQQMIITRYAKNNGVWESEESIKKKEETSLRHYGYKSPNSSLIVKQHKKDGCLRKFGVDHYSKTKMYHDQMIAVNDQRKAKEYATKKKNNSFNASKAEDHIYVFLCSQFSSNNVIRQYKSEAYPFNCDFYIKSKDLYIECNFSWTHGGHWFDEANEEDLKTLQRWKDKETKYYQNAIETWTIRDVKKRKTAEANHLNYIVQWKEDNNELKALLQNFS